MIKHVAQPRVRLFCFPYAGGGAYATYRAWGQLLPDGIELVGVQPPGREQRLNEKPFSSLPGLVEALVGELVRELNGPYALFGHSMGALLAFETARALRRAGAPAPVHLFTSAYRAPHLAPLREPIYMLRDDAFVDALNRRYNAIPAAVLAEPELLQVFLPLLRADTQLHETYAYEAGAPLAVPISSFGGTEDATVGAEHLSGWAQHTEAAFQLQMLPGGHFFLNEQRQPVVRAVSSKLLGVA